MQLNGKVQKYPPCSILPGGEGMRRANTVGRYGLSTSALSNHPSVSPCLISGHAIDGLHNTRFGIEIYEEAGYFYEVLVFHLTHLFILGSSMSLRPSPTKLNPIVNNRMNRPGKTTVHQYPATNHCCPSDTILPHSAYPVSTPKPM